MAKSWSEKFHSAKEPEVKQLQKDMIGMKKGQQMLLPTPKLVADYISSIPEGRTMDIKELRSALAEQAGAQVACPIVTSICLRTVAEYEYEQHEAGQKLSETVPVWRVLDEKTPTTKKLSFDPAPFFNERDREAALPRSN